MVSIPRGWRKAQHAPPSRRALRTGALDGGRKLGLFEDMVEEEGDTGRADFRWLAPAPPQFRPPNFFDNRSRRDRGSSIRYRIY
jgi:hypothetical protein